MINVFRSGDTTTVMMELTPALSSGMCLKVGVYTITGKPIYETRWPEDGRIKKLSDTIYALKLTNDDTLKMRVVTTLRVTIYTGDLEFVNAGESAMQLTWTPEPVNERLR